MGGLSFTTGYGYADGRGNRTSITQPGGWTITYAFDPANRVQTVSFPGASGTQTVTIAHDSLSRRTGVDRPGAAADTSYSYDIDNDLTGMTHAFVAGTGPGSTTYAYGRDAAGKVTSIGLNQPTFEWMPTLAYGRTYGPASTMNRIASVSDAVESRALTWSGDGNLSQEVRTPVGGGAPVTWTYHYTYGYRLAVLVNDAAVSPLTASYHYDSDDRRTKKVVNGVTTRTLWSGTSELAEYDVNGDLIRRFIPDGTVDKDGKPIMDARLATVTSSGEVFWHHTDHQGSVVATSDSNGKTVDTAAYSPHGEGSPPAQSPFGYTGRQYDPETGLYYYRARYYSPYLGQFLTRDPIGTKDDPNLYMYVRNDPANLVDSTGMTPEEAAAWARAQEGSRRWRKDTFNAEVGGRWSGGIWGGLGAPKCNIFVFDALVAGRVAPGRIDGRMPTAAEWADPSVRIANYAIVPADEASKPGDIVTNGEHVGIYTPTISGGRGDAERVEDPLVTSASTAYGNGGTIRTNDWGVRRDTENVVRRRYVGSGRNPGSTTTSSGIPSRIAGR